MRLWLAALVLLSACTLGAKAPDMPHGAAVAPPAGFIALCRRHPQEPNCLLSPRN